MVLTTVESLILISLITLGTLMTRALPFFLFPDKKETPQYILYLGKVLPFSVIGLLIIYCIKNVTLFQTPNGIPEALGILCTVLLHLWKKNTLLSIGGGTVLYMVLVQLVFI